MGPHLDAPLVSTEIELILQVQAVDSRSKPALLPRQSPWLGTFCEWRVYETRHSWPLAFLAYRNKGPTHWSPDPIDGPPPIVGQMLLSPLFQTYYADRRPLHAWANYWACRSPE